MSHNQIMSDDICPRVRQPEDAKLLNELDQFFKEHFHASPAIFVRVPGRVNLIGEHVDYCGFPVLPMAIEQCILLAVLPTDDTMLTLRNVNPKYAAFETDINSFEIEIPKTGGPAWYNYFLCGIKGVADYWCKNGSNLNGMKVAIVGNIPAASGLSSSSALVSSAVLAASAINNFSLNKELLATMAAKCERYIGTQGGGMDQAIAFLAQEGCAQFIEWNPIKASPVKLPANAVFIVANSLAEANKAATSDFNERVVECRIACSIIAHKMGLQWRDVNKFANLQRDLNVSLHDMDQLVDKFLVDTPYSRNDIVDELRISDAEFEYIFLTKNTVDCVAFKLKQRAQHVIQESIRVAKFRKIANNHGSISELGKLMRESHASLQELYECSHEKLNELVTISDEMGVPARLTGAGWGGCIVALCDGLVDSENYILRLKEKYFGWKGQNIDGRIVFATSPQSGAEIYINIEQ